MQISGRLGTNNDIDGLQLLCIARLGVEPFDVAWTMLPTAEMSDEAVCLSFL